MADRRQDPCPHCPHKWYVHRAAPPRTVYCLDCGCRWRTSWWAAWAVCVLYVVDELTGRGT